MIVKACVTTAGTSQEWEAVLMGLDSQSVGPKQTVGDSMLVCNHFFRKIVHHYAAGNANSAQ